MLTLQNICVTVGKGTTLERTIINQLNLAIAPGEFVIIIGGNGAGKSTLFNAISGYVPVDSGKISIEDANITNWPMHTRSTLIAQVLQDPRIGTLENMTIEENLSIAYMRGKSRGIKPYTTRERQTFFREQLSVLGIGLENRLQEVVSNLSGGQRQVLSLVMATITDSQILLLDEITAALDPKMAELVMQLTAQIVRKKRQTTLMITHNMAHALQYGDRTIVLKDGKMLSAFDAEQKKLLTTADLAAIFNEIS